MGLFLKSMAHPMFLLVLSLLLSSASSNLQSNEEEQEGYISVFLSKKGIDFAKDLLIDKAVSSMIPLQLPDIEKSVKIPLIGKVQIVLSSITIDSLNIGSSYVETEPAGIMLVASDATAGLSMKWRYSYKNWFFVISDSGDASVQVKGVEVGVNVAINEQEGALKLSLLDCGCNVKDISIKVDGGASWLYQVLVNAFEGPIGFAVERAISKKIKEGIVKLDSILQSLPKQIQVGHVAALNVTFMDNPALTNSSVEFAINGLFTAVDNILSPNNYYIGTQASVFCNDSTMIGIAFHEDVFNSAALVYYNAGYMHWILNKILNQSLLNTSTWKYIYPQLYQKYPNDNMNLNVSVTSAPVIHIREHGIDAIIYMDVTVNVLDAEEVIPIACISLVIDTSCAPKILRNKLAGIVKLRNFTTSLKWSNIGNMNIRLIRPLIFTVLETVFIPQVNLHLMKGFPLPLLDAITIQNTVMYYTDLKIVMCSNLAIN